MKLKCTYCNKQLEKSLGAVNRAKKMGFNIYCDKICAGKARRSNKSSIEKKKEKAAYDVRYRAKNIDWKMFNSAFNFVFDYQANPEKYKKKRINKREYQRNFCRQEWYRKWKKNYDKKYRAKKLYGEYADAALILFEIEGIINRQQARFDKGCHNKTKNRRKLWKSSQQ